MQPVANLARRTSVYPMCESKDAQKHAPSVINLQAVLAMAGGDIGLLRELAGAFLKEVPQLLQSLRSSAQSRDAEPLRNSAHQLQGVMRCLHMQGALGQARQLEELVGDDTDWQAVEQLLGELDATIRTATEKLQDFLRDLS